MSKHIYGTTAIEKVETQSDGSIRFEGIFSSEALDSQGDIVAQEATRKAIEGWHARNIREMHQPIAAGQAIDFEFLPDGRAKLVGFVSKGAADTTGAKLLDRTLKGMSIAGPPPTKFEFVKIADGKKARRILEYSLSEISLVDNAANPDAMGINILKAVGIEPEKPAEPAKPAEGQTVNRFAEALRKAIPATEPAKETQTEKPAEPEKTTEKAAKLAKREALRAVAKGLARLNPTLRKHYGGDEMGDMMTAVYLVQSGECCGEGIAALMAAEMAEDDPADAPDVAKLRAAKEACDAMCAALREFLAAEAQEVVAEPVEEIAASVPAPEMVKREDLEEWIKGLHEALAKGLATITPVNKSAGMTPEDGEQLTVAIGEEVRSQTSGVLKAVDEIKGVVAQTAADLKVQSELLLKIANAPMPIGAPVKHGNAPRFGADGRPEGLTPDLERWVMARAAAIVPDPSSRAVLTQVVRST